jgi:hypothetical protein
MVRSCVLWSGLVFYGPVLYSMVRSCILWSGLVFYGPVLYSEKSLSRRVPGGVSCLVGDHQGRRLGQPADQGGDRSRASVRWRASDVWPDTVECKTGARGAAGTGPRRWRSRARLAAARTRPSGPRRRRRTRTLCLRRGPARGPPTRRRRRRVARWCGGRGGARASSRTGSGGGGPRVGRALGACVQGV